MKKIIELDKRLFVKINQSWTNPFCDGLMPFLRQPLVWGPLYLFILVFVIYNFPKKAFAWILSLCITVTIADIVSSRFIKPMVGRIRPCRDIDLVENVRLLAAYCGQNGSFTSSHAANHFGIAMFLMITLRHVWGNYCYLFFLWAFAICYAQIYVGVHFPLDIIGGTAVGCLAGWITGSFFNHKAGILQPGIK